MNAILPVSPETMHRGAKLFMDRGDAKDYGEALAILGRLRLDIAVGADVAGSVGGQTALLTAVNLARRTMLGGVRVLGCPDSAIRTPLHRGTLTDAVTALGGVHGAGRDTGAQLLVIGAPGSPAEFSGGLRITWDGWAGGVVPASMSGRLAEEGNMALGPVVAAAIGVSEAFQAAISETPAAGRRRAGLSLWRPDTDWTLPDARGPRLAWLPSRLWLIGLGNLGQAFLWCLGSLPYAMPSEVMLTLQDDDDVQPSNDSTSVLTSAAVFGMPKTRMAAAWAERIGFRTRLLECRFGAWTRRCDFTGDPAVALCGVDNADSRMDLEDIGFSSVFEAGLGAGAQGYLNLTTHSFPAGMRARDIWGRVRDLPAAESTAVQPAYEAAAKAGLGDCGALMLARRTIGVPYVGMTAAVLVVGEILRRLNGGMGYDACSMSLACPQDIEVVAADRPTSYFGGATQTA